MFIRFERLYLPLWVYGLLWAAMQWLFWAAARAGIGWVAHLGGFALGLVAAFCADGQSIPTCVRKSTLFRLPPQVVLDEQVEQLARRGADRRRRRGCGRPPAASRARR